MELYFDCDPGIDDAIVLAYLAGEQRLGRIQLTAVTTVRGNLGVVESGRNAAFMLDRLGLGEVPVYRGATEPLIPLDIDVDAVPFHGTDGLGGTHDPSHPDRSEPESIERVHDVFSEAAARSVPVLATGPLTNVALAMERSPGLAAALPQLMVMGGAFGSPGGNITPVAEYNFHLDGLAAGRVSASGVPMTLIPLDITERVLIRTDDLNSIPTSPVGRLVRNLLLTSIETHRREMGVDGCIMHDALAAAVLLNPSLVEWTRGWLHVEATGDDRGHAELEVHPEGSVAVALDVDVEFARRTILEALSRL